MPPLGRSSKGMDVVPFFSGSLKRRYRKAASPASVCSSQKPPTSPSKKPTENVVVPSATPMNRTALTSSSVPNPPPAVPKNRASSGSQVGRHVPAKRGSGGGGGEFGPAGGADVEPSADAIRINVIDAAKNARTPGINLANKIAAPYPVECMRASD